MPNLVDFQKLLTNIKPGDKLQVQLSPRGKLIMTDNTTKEDILRTEYGSLLESKITLSEAAKKYNVPRATISAWVYRSNYITAVEGTAYPALFNEAEIAYLVDIYRRRRESGSKAPLLDERGLPYELKLPDLAEYRKNKR